jgi:hypothetical protein
MTMVCIGDVRVVVRERSMAMGVTVRVARRILWSMLMPVMIVVHMQMLVLEVLVSMHVGVTLAQ